jgi:beta-lactamase superfamily II metal-dependent hydrolase
MELTLEALQANDGDCLLLHYQPAGGKMVRILIDGGSRGIYSRVLRPRLDQLRGNDPLDLRMILVSHIDADHITGIQDLLRAFEQDEQDGEEPFCRVATLWFNSFERLSGGRAAAAESAAVAASLGGTVPAGLDDFASAVVASVKQGNDVRNAATRLGIPLNHGAGGDLIRSPASGVSRIPIAPGLTFTILGPGQEQLERLDEEWQVSKTKHPGDVTAQAADYLNRTVPNLSSIVVLAEADRGADRPLRMLLTGDAGGDEILKSLKRAGIADAAGRCHVDLLKVMHHGSNHSVARDFFERVTADRYVISGNGRHGNPHPDTLEWLSAARAGVEYDAYLTNRIGQSDLERVLESFLQRERQQPAHRYHFRAEDALSIPVPLV